MKLDGIGETEFRQLGKAYAAYLLTAFAVLSFVTVLTGERASPSYLIWFISFVALGVKSLRLHYTLGDALERRKILWIAEGAILLNVLTVVGMSAQGISGTTAKRCAIPPRRRTGLVGLHHMPVYWHFQGRSFRFSTRDQEDRSSHDTDRIYSFRLSSAGRGSRKPSGSVHSSRKSVRCHILHIGDRSGIHASQEQDSGTRGSPFVSKKI
jgi:hypothetical protein